jgi:hypothetical protein
MLTFFGTLHGDLYCAPSGRLKAISVWPSHQAIFAILRVREIGVTTTLFPHNGSLAIRIHSLNDVSHSRMPGDTRLQGDADTKDRGRVRE